MKQILLASIVMLSYTCTNAQIKKGSLWLGGSASYSRNKSSDDEYPWKYLYLAISPGVGWVVKDNLVAGIEFNHFKNKRTEQYNDQITDNHRTGGGVFVRRYFPVLNRLYVFGHAGVKVLSITDDVVSKIEERKGDGWSSEVFLYPGVSFAAGKKFHLETGLGNLLSAGYSKVVYKKPGTMDNKVETNWGGLSFEGVSSIYLGIRMIL